MKFRCTNNEDNNMECSVKTKSYSLSDERFLARTELESNDKDEESKSDEDDIAKYSYILISIFLAQIFFCCCMIMCTGARVH